MRKWLVFMSLSLVASGCAHTAAPGSASAPEWGDAFTAGEDKTCSHFECENFMAPCDLMEAPGTRQTTVLEDEYRDKILAYQSVGYCMNAPRPIKNYSKRTCFFLLVRGERNCTTKK